MTAEETISAVIFSLSCRVPFTIGWVQKGPFAYLTIYPTSDAYVHHHRISMVCTLTGVH